MGSGIVFILSRSNGIGPAQHLADPLQGFLYELFCAEVTEGPQNPLRYIEFEHEHRNRRTVTTRAANRLVDAIK